MPKEDFCGDKQKIVQQIKRATAATVQASACCSDSCLLQSFATISHLFQMIALLRKGNPLWRDVSASSIWTLSNSRISSEFH